MITLSFDWFTVLSVSSVTGYSGPFGFILQHSVENCSICIALLGGFDDRGGRHGGQGNLFRAALTMSLVSKCKLYFIFMVLIYFKTL